MVVVVMVEGVKLMTGVMQCSRSFLATLYSCPSADVTPAQTYSFCLIHKRLCALSFMDFKDLVQQKQEAVPAWPPTTSIHKMSATSVAMKRASAAPHPPRNTLLVYNNNSGVQE